MRVKLGCSQTIHRLFKVVPTIQLLQILRSCLWLGVRGGGVGRGLVLILKNMLYTKKNQ